MQSFTSSLIDSHGAQNSLQAIFVDLVYGRGGTTELKRRALFRTSGLKRTMKSNLVNRKKRRIHFCVRYPFAHAQNTCR